MGNYSLACFSSNLEPKFVLPTEYFGVLNELMGSSAYKWYAPTPGILTFSLSEKSYSLLWMLTETPGVLDIVYTFGPGTVKEPVRTADGRFILPNEYF